MEYKSPNNLTLSLTDEQIKSLLEDGKAPKPSAALGEKLRRLRQDLDVAVQIDRIHDIQLHAERLESHYSTLSSMGMDVDLRTAFLLRAAMTLASQAAK